MTSLGKTRTTKTAAKAASSATNLTPSGRRTSFTNNPTSVTTSALLKDLVAKVSLLEKEVTTLKKTNKDLSIELNSLRERTDEQQNLINTIQAQNHATETGISVEQEEINSNIVIRGVEVKSDSPIESVLIAFKGLCSYLGVQDVPEFIPESINIVPSTNK